MSLRRFVCVLAFSCALLFSVSFAYADERAPLQSSVQEQVSIVSEDEAVVLLQNADEQQGDTATDVLETARESEAEDASSNDTEEPNAPVNARAAAPAQEAPLAAMASASSSLETVDMHRLYNPNSGEHFYTGATDERDHLVSLGWKYEGVGWVAPKISEHPVFRLYNPNAGDHHYTLAEAERDMLTGVGWNYEGIGWYSDGSMRYAVFRQYNPNAVAGAHNFTTSQAENAMLVDAGWKAEGVAWYAVAEGKPAESKPSDSKSYIYLDAGHGMGSSTKGVYDPGAGGCGYEEAKLTAELVSLTAQYARSLYGLNVYTNVDANVPYYERQEDAKNRGCTSLVSIHFNASSGGGTGAESYIHTRAAAAGSDKLQGIMHGHLVKGIGVRDRGARKMALSVCNGSETGIPATLLEVCFIDNSYDMKMYQKNKDALARELAAGLNEAVRAGF